MPGRITHPSDTAKLPTPATVEGDRRLHRTVQRTVIEGNLCTIGKPAKHDGDCVFGTINRWQPLAQRWAERRRRILLILPATLRKQWQQKIEDKFFLPTVVLASRNFKQYQRDGHPNPFEQDGRVVACSYHFASAKSQEVRRVNRDLVVIDEAHRLRNVYKTGNKMARNIAEAISGSPKLLLTATPLQNSLMELYGLVSIIDPHVEPANVDDDDSADALGFVELRHRRHVAKARDPP